MTDTKIKYFQTAKEHFQSEFNRLYGVDPVTPVTPTPPEWSDEERSRYLVTMASTTIWLSRGAERVRDVIGREAQGQVLGHLKSVVPALRKGFDLERSR